MVKIKEILEAVKSAPGKYPVETAVGLTYSVLTMLVVDNEISSSYGPMFVFVVFAAAITLHKVNKWAYYASYLLVWVACWFGNEHVLEKPWFWVLNAVALVVLVADLKQGDNRSFANALIGRVGQMAAALLLSGILALMVSAIFRTVTYLFDVDSWRLLLRINIVIAFLILPLVYCNLQSDEDGGDGGRLVRILVDFIMSPALVAYTLILLVYILKIVVIQELPRGGVAYIVSIYIALALVGNLFNKLVTNSHFNWFYNNFTYIAIAPIVLLWIGTAYRIDEYGLTEWRVYLLIVNVLMTVFPLMLKIPRLAHYNIMTFVLLAAMVVFTCIPPLSAHRISVRNQYSRFLRHANELGVLDTETGRFKDMEMIDFKAIHSDSTLGAALEAMENEIRYLNRYDTILKQHGNWTRNEWSSYLDDDVEQSPVTYSLISIENKVSTEGYPRLYLDYDVKYNGGHVLVSIDGRRVVDYPIEDIVTTDSSACEHLDKLLVYSNGNFMIVIKKIRISNDRGVVEVRAEDVLLFGK